ncbi:UDP-N-acetylglucosamine 1-carboxyvinyltransferase [Streptomyces hydrogenans]|uniref:UDP-N-acetylglucosamine 1-carboxyvinyltransferase n=1 Tax=Streptomyces hydrogenans TaxID=1873719 RepID=UPI003635AC27
MNLVHARTRDVDAVTVRPGRPLAGTVRVDGSKNAALPLLAAAASLGRAVHLSGVPASADVQRMLDLLEQAGYHVAYPVAEPGAVVITPEKQSSKAPGLSDAARIRASYYLVAPLLAAYGQAALPWPGGCQIGDRGMELHFTVYEAFGDIVLLDDTGYRVLAADQTRDKVVLALPFRSRGASIAAICRAVVAGCRLELGTPNLSPETTGVLTALRSAGWAGVPLTLTPDAITVHRPRTVSGGPLQAIASLTPDGLDADFEPALMALALTLPGTHLFADDINPGRHGNLLPQLTRLGAVIEELSPTRCRLSGPQRLNGTPVKATDIRTGSALLIAGLGARGATTVSGLDQLRRGHADLPAKLRTLGADLTDVPR